MDAIAARNALARLARIDDATRLYRLDLASDAPLLVERWQGDERLSHGFEWQVDVLSTDAGLPLEGWLGRPARLLTRLADGGEAVRSGLVREAVLLGADGGLARYRLQLVPWTWLLTQGRHSRVFEDRSVVEIVESVFASYAPLARWTLADEVAGFLADARPRSYCVHYRESDFDFVSRLLAEEGLGWRIEENADAPAGHVLALFADSTLLPEDASSAAQGGIRFHRSDATEAQDSILAIGRRQRIGSDRLTVLSDDYKRARALGVELPMRSVANDVALEAYDPVGPYAFADANEAQRYAGLMAQADEAQRDTHVGEATARTLRAGTWFGLTQSAGGSADSQELVLTRVRQLGINNLPVDLREQVREVLGDTRANAGFPASLHRQAEAVGYAARFDAVPRGLAWRPVLADGTGTRLNPRPTAPGYQTAIVVDGEGNSSPSGGQEVHCDRLGRIRVRFHFMDDADRDAGAARASCWLRVAQRYAGPGVGAQFLPRIGQEVLVAFIDGDIDRPVVVGALYNGRGEAGVPATPGGKRADADSSAYAQASDHRPSAQANLAGGHAPPWHGMGGGDDAHRHAGALWGIQSKEWGGGGHNRLLFDDSDGQLRLQLSTTHACSQLNLGHLVHQADNYRGSFRGEGFELRTDAWGAVRAERGLWLSAYGVDNASPAGTAVAPAALLDQLARLGETFSRAATIHQTVKLAAHDGVQQAEQSALIADQAPLAALRASVRTTVPGAAWNDAASAAAERSPAAGANRVPHTGDAIVGLAAPAGIGLIAGQSLHWSAGETITLASGGASNLAVAGDLRIHTGQAIGLLAAAVEGQTEANTLSLVSGEGELDLQAQNDQVRLRSRDQLRIVSANAEVDLAAGRTIHLATAGGASLTIEGGNITIACPGTIKVHAAKKSFVGPTSLERELVQFQPVCIDCILKAAIAGTPVVPL
ncbi:type VI secretion system tip protein VgrG [Luteimonas yindakuii]|uniref:type VI secretion system Vgr family protein n=1 Tax=Luteimonas yindakuii TaxID=2565782 RepID=UPI0010A54208|nr:type VI secretion system Vgr family protein [Luteimonas yindakuii]QCO66885.1 type VI secretion system tip protein VgrG [Luteimonas yindakuii]